MEHRLRPKQIIKAHIASGKKELEVRVGDEKRKRIRVGDTLIFDFGDQAYRRRVGGICIYPSFAAMLEAEDAERIMPGWNKQQVQRGLRTIYTKEKEQLGVYVFELETIP